MPGHLRMHTTETPAAMTRLAATGERMTTDWNTTNADITTLASQLGKDELGTAFLAGYQQAAADTTRAVEHHCQQPNQLASTGNQAMTQYTAVDSAHQQAIRSALPNQPTL